MAWQIEDEVGWPTLPICFKQVSNETSNSSASLSPRADFQQVIDQVA